MGHIPLVERIAALIPEVLSFKLRKMHEREDLQWQADVFVDLGHILVVIDTRDTLQPAEGEQWRWERPIVKKHWPGFALVSVSLVATPVTIEELGLRTAEPQGHRPKPEPKEPTGQFLEEQRPSRIRNPNGRAAKIAAKVAAAKKAAAEEKIAAGERSGRLVPLSSPEIKAGEAFQRDANRRGKPEGRGKQVDGVHKRSASAPRTG